MSEGFNEIAIIPVTIGLNKAENQKKVGQLRPAFSALFLIAEVSWAKRVSSQLVILLLAQQQRDFFISLSVQE